MDHRRIGAAFLACMMGSLGCSRAADINYQHTQGANIITISGTIAQGDATKFRRITMIPQDKTIVMLSSPGGVVNDALIIGDMIHTLGFMTVVPGKQFCTSACGLIWLGGKTRLADGTAYIGFHAAYTGSGETAIQSGSANALVGAYLNRLGLSFSAVEALTSAPPNGMRWLNFEDIQKIGVQFSILPELPFPGHASPGVAARSDEQRALAFVQSYYAVWSRSGNDMAGLQQYYADFANFHGAATSKSKIIEAKRYFSLQWPIRNYAIKPETVTTDCSPADCLVTGMVEWDVQNVVHNRRARGTDTFVVKVNRSEPMTILSENGSITPVSTERISQDRLPSIVSLVPEHDDVSRRDGPASIRPQASR